DAEAILQFGGPARRIAPTSKQREWGEAIMRLGTTRRGFLAGTAAIGAAGALPGIRGQALAQNRTLNIRADLDADVLDPGYMSGGIEIEVQKQVLPILATY